MMDGMISGIGDEVVVAGNHTLVGVVIVSGTTVFSGVLDIGVGVQAEENEKKDRITRRKIFKFLFLPSLIIFSPNRLAI